MEKNKQKKHPTFNSFVYNVKKMRLKETEDLPKITYSKSREESRDLDLCFVAYTKKRMLVLSTEVLGGYFMGGLFTHKPLALFMCWCLPIYSV